MINTNLLPIVFIGGGGHASVLADILIRQQREIIAIIAHNNGKLFSTFPGILHLQKDEEVKKFSPDSIRLVNGVGQLPNTNTRKDLNNYFLSLGYHFENVIADTSIVSSQAVIGEGVQILQGAIVQANSHIGSHTIINTGAIVEHDCIVGRHNHIAPASVLCGQVKTGNDVFIGAGAIILPGINIGRKAIVGAGVTLKESLLGKAVVYSTRPYIKNHIDKQ